MHIGKDVTILVVNEQDTDAPRFEDEYLFVSHPVRDAKVTRYIHRVRGNLEDENGTEYAICSFSCDIDLTNRDSAWQ